MHGTGDIACKAQKPEKTNSVTISKQHINMESARPNSIRDAPWVRAIVDEAQEALICMPPPVSLNLFEI
jgi:hypothetical protein